MNEFSYLTNAIAEKNPAKDKNRHDTVSFMLGMLKEFKDVFGHGNAEAADFKADVHGVSPSSKGAAKTAVECLSQCDL